MFSSKVRIRNHFFL